MGGHINAPFERLNLQGDLALLGRACVHIGRGQPKLKVDLGHHLAAVLLQAQPDLTGTGPQRSEPLRVGRRHGQALGQALQPLDRDPRRGKAGQPAATVQTGRRQPHR